MGFDLHKKFQQFGMTAYEEDTGTIIIIVIIVFVAICIICICCCCCIGCCACLVAQAD